LQKIGYDGRMRNTRILMCEPRHFHVDYVINPWMEGNVDQASPERARRQWHALRDTLARFSAVVEVPPQKGLPDMVFTANAGTVCGKRGVEQLLPSGTPR
jgi:N-dimethylarginine dimethylaminohydrolase